MAASATLLSTRRAEGLCPRDGRPAAPFAYCEECRHSRTAASARSAAKKAGNALPASGRGALASEDLDDLLVHAAANGEAVLYRPPLRGQGHGVELVERPVDTAHDERATVPLLVRP